jgi:predicted nucleic acid-binding Zn ribbon protein
VSDRRLWLAEPCPFCHARSGLRCQTSRYGGKPARLLHAARGWRQPACATCKAQPGEPCHTPVGRKASQPHAVRLGRARRELLGDEQVWQELERWGACRALVRFSGGGGSPGSIAAVTLEGDGDELARWDGGSGELAEALADPIWGRYALFRGHPRITGLLQWDVREREFLVAGKRGDQALAEVLSAPRQLSRAPVTPVISSVSDDTSPGSSAVGVERERSGAAAGVLQALRLCARCGGPLAVGLRPEARYCSKRCRQASSRERLKDRPSSPPSVVLEECVWCGGPIPEGLRAEARFCSKRCRQASSRHTLRARRASSAGSGPDETPAATATPKAKARGRNDSSRRRSDRGDPRPLSRPAGRLQAPGATVLPGSPGA